MSERANLSQEMGLGGVKKESIEAGIINDVVFVEQTRLGREIVENNEQVSYLGVTLKKAKNAEGQLVPKREQYVDFINDEEIALPLQRDIAVAFLSGEPMLVEGGTSLGKTTTVKKMAAELGYEVHYVNLNGATDVEDLMGRYIPNPHKNKPEDPEYIFADGKVTSGLRQEEYKVKVIILDEYNAAAPNILIRLHEVLDALERGGDVILSEDASEAVSTNKTRTKIIALMNSPGKGYFGREPLDPAQLRRWVYKKLPSELPEGTFSYSTDALFGAEPASQNITPDMFLNARKETLTPEQLQEVPGMWEVLEKYKEFHKAAKKLLKNRKVAEDQPQTFTFDDRMEPRRVRDFVLRFYNGDINETFQQALQYYYANKLESDADRKKLGELIRLVEYKPPAAESKRRGSERKKKTEKDKTEGLEAAKSSMEQAAEIMGANNYFGLAAVEKTFGIKLELESIPEIPFSQEDLERAKELGQFLILRVEKIATGKPLTMESMQALLQQKLDKEKSGKILFNTDWYKNEDFFKKDIPQLDWALVTEEVVPNSTGKNFVGQTATLASYLKDKVFKDKPLPKEYKQAIDEFEKQKDKLKELIAKDWQEAAKQLSELKLNQLTRQAPVEVIYDMAVRFQSRSDKDRLLENKYTWTERLSSDGRLVDIGRFDAGGAGVYSWNPVFSDGALGVSFSRSH